MVCMIKMHPCILVPFLHCTYVYALLCKCMHIIHNSTLRVPSLPPPIVVYCRLHSRQSHHQYLNLNELLAGRAYTLCIFGPLPNLGCVYCWRGEGGRWAYFQEVNVLSGIAKIKTLVIWILTAIGTHACIMLVEIGEFLHQITKLKLRQSFPLYDMQLLGKR